MEMSKRVGYHVPFTKTGSVSVPAIGISSFKHVCFGVSIFLSMDGFLRTWCGVVCEGSL